MSDNDKGRRDERKKGGALPLIGSSAEDLVGGVSAGGRGAGGGGGFASFLRAVLSPLGGFGETLASGLSSPMALGLLVGMTAVGGGYGIVTIWKKASSDGGPGRSIFRPAPSMPASDGRAARPYGGTMGSLEMFAKTNKGAMEEGAPKDEEASDSKEDMPNDTPAPAVDPDQLAAAAEAANASANAGAALAKGRLAPMEGFFGKSGGVSGSALFAGAPGAVGGGAAGGAAGGGGAPGAGGGRLSSSRVQKRPVLGSAGQSTRGNSRNALGQLRNAAALSGRGAATPSDTGSKFLADQAFQGAGGGPANPIGGTGLTQGAGGLSPGAGNVPPSSGGPTGNPGPGSGPGPGGTTCTGPNCSTGGPNEPLSGVNVNPLQWLIDNKIKMLIAAVAMLGIAFALKFTRVPFLLGLAKFLAYGAAAAFAGVAAAGAMLAVAGDTMTGAIFTVVGATGVIMAMKLAKSISNKKSDIELGRLTEKAESIRRQLQDPALTPGRRGELQNQLKRIEAELGGRGAGAPTGPPPGGAPGEGGGGPGGGQAVKADPNAPETEAAAAARHQELLSNLKPVGSQQSSGYMPVDAGVPGSSPVTAASPAPSLPTFPLNPADGERFTDAAGTVWRYSGYGGVNGWHILGGP